MINTKTTISVDKVTHMSFWGDLTFNCEGNEINFKLTDEQWAELGRRASQESKRRKERKLETLREELEELKNAETDD